MDNNVEEFLTKIELEKTEVLNRLIDARDKAIEMDATSVMIILLDKENDSYINTYFQERIALIGALEETKFAIIKEYANT